MWGDHDVTHRQHGFVTLASHTRKLDPTAVFVGQRRRVALRKTRRRQRDEQAIDIAWLDPVRIGWKRKSALQRRERQNHLRVGRCSDRVVPKPHVPRARYPGRVAPLNRQRRAVDSVKRDQPRRAPAECQRQPRIIPRRFISEQRMIPAVLAFPDQAYQIVGLAEHRIDPQGVGRQRCHAGHGWTREIDRPEARIEALDRVCLLHRASTREPECHCGFLSVIG